MENVYSLKQCKQDMIEIWQWFVDNPSKNKDDLIKCFPKYKLFHNICPCCEYALNKTRYKWRNVIKKYFLLFMRVSRKNINNNILNCWNCPIYKWKKSNCNTFNGEYNWFANSNGYFSLRKKYAQKILELAIKIKED